MSNGYTIPESYEDWVHLSQEQRDFALWATLRENQDCIKSLTNTQQQRIWWDRFLAVSGGFAGGAIAVITKFLAF